MHLYMAVRIYVSTCIQSDTILYPCWIIRVALTPEQSDVSRSCPHYGGALSSSPTSMVDEVGVEPGVGVVVAERGSGGESGAPLDDVAGVMCDESSDVAAPSSASAASASQ